MVEWAIMMINGCPECEKVTGGCPRHSRITAYLQPETIKAPYRCPVCGGKGKVPAGFFGAIGVDVWSASKSGPDECQPCGGSGVLWG